MVAMRAYGTAAVCICDTRTHSSTPPPFLASQTVLGGDGLEDTPVFYSGYTNNNSLWGAVDWKYCLLVIVFYLGSGIYAIWRLGTTTVSVRFAEPAAGGALYLRCSRSFAFLSTSPPSCLLLPLSHRKRASTRRITLPPTLGATRSGAAGAWG